MKRITTFIILLFLCADCLAQQDPVQVVHTYITTLSDALSSPDDMIRRREIENLLGAGSPGIKDEIVERYNTKSTSRMLAGPYLAIFYDVIQNSSTSWIKVSIIGTPTVKEDRGISVYATLQYSGAITLKTSSEFWIENGKITGIMADEKGIAKISSSGGGGNVPPSQNGTPTPDQPKTDPPKPSASTITVDGLTYGNMILVKGGTFQMGATSEQGSDVGSDEKPVHTVTLSDYYIGETEVTQGLWKAVMGSNPSDESRGIGDDLPVHDVSWNDCQDFIKKLNQKTGKHFRLPTEAEWEYAARGGSKSRGYKYSGSNTIGDVAWYTDNSGYKVHPVKSKSPNELGLYDMTGNVWEWCSDWYKSDYYSNSPSTNPRGPSSGSYRVLRGGSWYYYARDCRVSYRSNSDPTFRGSGSGLRLLLSSPKKQEKN